MITSFCLVLSTTLMAQTKMTNTTTITVDKNINGKITQEVYVIEGDGADEKLKALKKDISVVNINVEKRVEMSSDNPNGDDVKKMRNEVEVEIKAMESTTGVKAQKREENVEIEITENDTNEIKKYKVKIIENGKEEIIEWNGEGEMPEKMKEVMDNSEGNIKTEGSTKSYQFKIMNAEEMGIDESAVIREKNNNRGQIGVRIGKSKGGVEILSFPENSTAEAAGLLVGDVITGINDKVISSIQGLVNALTPYKPGDIVSINFIRGDQMMKKEVKMDKR